MPKPSPLVQLAGGALILAFAVLGITNSVHASARVFYAALIVLGLGCVTLGVRRRRSFAASKRPER